MCHEIPNFYIEIRKVTSSSEREYWCLKYFGEKLLDDKYKDYDSILSN